MNGVAPPKRDSTPQGPYFPFHRDETYPRTLCVNFKRLEVRASFLATYRNQVELLLGRAVAFLRGKLLSL